MSASQSGSEASIDRQRTPNNISFEPEKRHSSEPAGDYSTVSPPEDESLEDRSRHRMDLSLNRSQEETHVTNDNVIPNPTQAFSEIPQSQPNIEQAGITSNGRQEPVVWPGEAFVMYKRLVKLQDRFLRAQTRLESERDALQPRLDSLDESLSRLSRILEEVSRRKTVASEDGAWASACKEFAVDRQSFEHQMQVVDGQEQRLGKLLYKLAKVEPEFLELVDAYFKNEQQMQHSSSTTSEHPSHALNEELEPLKLQYYDRRGNVRLLRERLNNHRADFQVTSDFRPSPVASATGDQYVQSTAFHKWWDAEQKTIMEELRIAEEQLILLWQQCRDAELDVGKLEVELSDTADGFMKPRETSGHEPSSADLNVPPFVPNRQGVITDLVKDIRWSTRRDRIAPFIDELVKFTGKREFIEEWVGKVLPGHNEFDHEILSPNSDPDWALIDWDDTDYVQVSNDANASAPNGEALVSRQPGIARSMLRKVASEGLLFTKFWR